MWKSVVRKSTVRLSVSALILLTAFETGAQAAAKKRSGPGLKYLPPSAFAELPGKIVKDLESRKCMIPQYPKSWTATDRINVLLGQFSKPGQKDWAIVCADASDDTLLVYWKGSDENPGEVPLGPRDAYLVSAPVPKEALEQKYSEQLNGVAPDHEGIGVTGHDNQTVVQYFRDGKAIALRPIPHP